MVDVVMERVACECLWYGLSQCHSRLDLPRGGLWGCVLLAVGASVVGNCQRLLAVIRQRTCCLLRRSDPSVINPLDASVRTTDDDDTVW